MFEFRHLAYNVGTGEIINCASGNTLKRKAKATNKHDTRLFGKVPCTWRFCHDYGKKWDKEGLPVR